MSREILFRGKTARGEWVEGYFFKGKWYLNDTEIIAIAPLDLAIYPHCEISEYAEVIPETVGQYTGLMDCNGKKIFEDDIIKNNEGYVFSGTHNCIVVFNNGKFYGEGFCDFEPSDFEHCEVIGNIHDNPELLI